MPTVPPVPVAPFASLDVLANATADVVPEVIHSDGPTPDPEVDDVLMLSVVPGEATAVAIVSTRFQ
jgi:hypothetical protein